MNPIWFRLVRGMVDILLVIWFFSTVRPEATPIRRSRHLFGHCCLLATLPIYLLLPELTSILFRSLSRILAYALYLRLSKEIRVRRCIYFSLIAWLSFNICSNVFLSSPLRVWFFATDPSLLPSALSFLMYIILLFLIRKAIPLEHIPRPGNFRILFALLLMLTQLFLRHVLDIVEVSSVPHSTDLAFCLILTQLLLGASLPLFEQFQARSEQSTREKIASLSNEYRYETALCRQEAKEDVRRMHHDMQNHLLAIQQLSGDNNRLNSYISALVSDLNDHNQPFETGNTLIDGLMSKKIKAAEPDSISFGVNLDLRPCSYVEDMDLCVIFGNLLDNAIEASKKVSDIRRRSVLIKSHQAAGNLVITFSNFYEGTLRLTDDLPQTTKSSPLHHGIGLSNVRRSAEKYGGALTVQLADSQRVLVSVFLPVEMP